MTTTDKINALNRFLRGTMVISHYNAFGGHWEISSFGENTLFEPRGEYYQRYGLPKHHSFDGVINRAHDRMVNYQTTKGAEK